MHKKQRKEIDGRIRHYGGDILKSDLFQRLLSQTHHMQTSVGKHSISTARMGLALCDFLRRHGVEVDEEQVVRICLLHDAGMLDRYERYQNNFECGRLHPENSAKVAKEVWKDIDPKSLEAIKSHMWPLSFSMPRSKEAAVLCMADKMASIKDILPFGK